MIEITDEMREYFNNELWDINIDHPEWEQHTSRVMKRIIELHEANKPKPEPVKPDVYSNDGGEYWVQYPADCDIFSDWEDDPKVGDEYELQVCWTGKQKFRIAEIEDGSVEKVELIDSDTTYYTTPPARKPLSDYELREMLNDLNEGDGTIYDFARLIEQSHGIGVGQ